MHEPSFKGVGIKVCALSGGAGLDQQLADLRQHGQVLLAFEQGLKRLQFRSVEFTAAGTVHLQPQVMGEQVGQRHLTAGPGGNSSRFAGAHLDVGRHVPEADEFQLPTREKEHILRLELADEGLFHMAQHGTSHKAHRDGRCGRGRADVEPMQPGNRFVSDPVATRFPIPFQFPVAGIRRQAFAALFQEQQAPVPVLMR